MRRWLSILALVLAIPPVAPAGRVFTKASFTRVDLGHGYLGESWVGLLAISISAWVRVDGTLDTGTSDNRIVSCYINGTTSGMVLRLDSSRRVAFGVRSQLADTFNSGSGTVAIASGTWQQIGLVVDWANDQVYTVVNGAVQGPNAATFGSSTWSLGSPSDDDTLGSDGGGTSARTFPGAIGHVAIWHKALSAEEWSALARFAPDRIPSRPAMYWPMDAAETVSTHWELVSGDSGASNPSGSISSTDSPPIIR